MLVVWILTLTIPAMVTSLAAAGLGWVGQARRSPLGMAKERMKERRARSGRVLVLAWLWGSPLIVSTWPPAVQGGRCKSATSAGRALRQGQLTTGGPVMGHAQPLAGLAQLLPALMLSSNQLLAARVNANRVNTHLVGVRVLQVDVLRHEARHLQQAAAGRRTSR